MASHSHDHRETQPVTDHIHENSWSANLEKPEHAENRGLVVDQAIEVIEYTTGGNHVNLVTHEAHGHPEDYLYDALADRFDGEGIRWEHRAQRGCGGHVVRVQVEYQT
jgi:putative CGCGG family rSAM target protein